MIAVESNAMFFINGDVCKEFATNEHYVGHARNCLAPSFRVDVDGYEGYMVVVHA